MPVRYLDLDPADAHLLALADNKLNGSPGGTPPPRGCHPCPEYGLDDAAIAVRGLRGTRRMAAEMLDTADGSGVEDVEPQVQQG